MVEAVKTAFANRLTERLKIAYRGHLPSISVIARDFSLKAPHLPHISGETIRKWLRGDSVPHVSRMQVLIEWLGPDIAHPFENHAKALVKGNTQPRGIAEPVAENVSELLHLAEQLTEKEYQSILSIARLLAQKHTTEAIPGEIRGNGHHQFKHS